MSYAYDDPGRRTSLSRGNGTVTRFAYDGPYMTGEIANPSGSLQRRYVYGPGEDEPLIWYEGSGTADRRGQFRGHYT